MNGYKKLQNVTAYIQTLSHKPLIFNGYKKLQKVTKSVTTVTVNCQTVKHFIDFYFVTT